MKRLRYALALIVIAMLAGCGRKEAAKRDAIDTIVETTAKNEQDDSIAVARDDGETQETIIQKDTQETLEWSLFARKKETMYSPELLCGEWVCGTLHEVYYGDGTGLQWDTKDDVSRDEAQKFSWQMENNCLRQVYTMQLGGVVPRVYTVTYADDESLVYKDDFGTSYMWDKGN